MRAADRNAKVPFTKAKFSKIKNVRNLSWENAFDVEFEDGLCILEPHATIRRANKISPKARFDHLEVEDWCQAGFFVHYDNGQVAEVSWSFIRELTPKNERPLRRFNIEEILNLTKIELWFLTQIREMVNFEQKWRLRSINRGSYTGPPFKTEPNRRCFRSRHRHPSLCADFAASCA